METRNANRILPGAGVLRSSAAMTRHQEISDEDVVAPNPPRGRVPMEGRRGAAAKS